MQRGTEKERVMFGNDEVVMRQERKVEEMTIEIAEVVMIESLND